MKQHRLSCRDYEKMTALCRICGPTIIKKAAKKPDKFGKIRYRCLNSINVTITKANLRVRLKKYNIEPEQYRALFDKQNGSCAICSKEQTKGHPLCIDHSHRTGKIRGLLCRRCNVMLGMAKEEAATLWSGIEYLKKDAEENVQLRHEHTASGLHRNGNGSQKVGGEIFQELEDEQWAWLGLGNNRSGQA